MLLTTAEAKQKDCPWFRAREVAPNCEADACMMWRWCQKKARQKDNQSTLRGFCGLALEPVE